jgi:hypothetical protein
MTKVDDQSKCSIMITDGVVTVKGPCADSIARQHGFLQALSTALGREISFQQCVNPSTARVERLVIHTLLVTLLQLSLRTSACANRASFR